MEPPRLPWEVIERVIDQSDGHSATLRSFSLTCRQLRPRSRCMLFSRVEFKNKDQVFAFVDFLQGNPHIKPFVHSVVVEPTDFPPFPLLHLLSNLSEIRFARPKQYLSQGDTVSALHQSMLTCLQRFAHMDTLHISKIRFATYLPFARLLAAFPNISHLTCEEVAIQAVGGRAPLEVIRRRLFTQMRLKSLTIDADFEIHRDRDASVLAFLSDAESAPLVVEKLRVLMGSTKSPIFSRRFGWSSLRALVVCVPFMFGLVNAVKFLENFQGPMLQEVMVELGPLPSTRFLGLDPLVSECRSIERALLKFPKPRLLLTIDKPLYPNIHSFWARKMGKNFTVLYKRDALTVKANTVSSAAGHDDIIHALAVSPDAKWVASASSDSTIILWDTDTGLVAHQWVAHDNRPVWSLAFSPDSRHLLSGGEDGTAVIWSLDFSSDPDEPPRSLGFAQPTAGRGGKPRYEYFRRAVSHCAWSPDGALVAHLSTPAGNLVGTLALWGGLGTTFERLCDLDAGQAQYVAFSPDGRWLASETVASPSRYCCCKIWDIAGRALHREIRHGRLRADRYECPEPQAAPVFDPGSKRIATVWGPGGGVDVWDVESGERVFGFEDEHLMNVVSFSPDGTLLLAGFDDGSVRLWDASTGVQLSVKFEGQARWRLAAACFSPCGKYIAAASYGGAMVLWRIGDRSRVATFEPSELDETAVVLDYAAVAFAPDGKKLVMFGTNSTDAVVIKSMQDVLWVYKRRHRVAQTGSKFTGTHIISSPSLRPTRTTSSEDSEM